MATRTESVHLTEADIKSAISDWLHKMYGVGEFDIVIDHNIHYDDVTSYFASAKRDVK